MLMPRGWVSWWRLAPLFAALLLLAGCFGPGGEPSLEERAQAIDRSLMCPICAGQNIDQSNAALAKQMQAVVREKLREGWTEGQVRRYFVERYGERVLAAPPQRGFHLVAWLVPPLGLLGGAALLTLVLRAMRRRGAPAPGPTPPESPAGLAPYLAQVDRELGVAPATPHVRRQGAGVAEGGHGGTGERGGL